MHPPLTTFNTPQTLKCAKDRETIVWKMPTSKISAVKMYCITLLHDILFKTRLLLPIVFIFVKKNHKN